MFKSCHDVMKWELEQQHTSIVTKETPSKHSRNKFSRKSWHVLLNILLPAINKRLNRNFHQRSELKRENWWYNNLETVLQEVALWEKDRRHRKWNCYDRGRYVSDVIVRKLIENCGKMRASVMMSFTVSASKTQFSF